MIDEKQQVLLNKLANDPCDDNLWYAVIAFQYEPFFTVSGLPFEYELKTGKDGTYNREIIVNRREFSKTIVWSSVILAFHNALDLRGTIVERPKALGDIRGISYIYPLLYRFNLIQIPEKFTSVLRNSYIS